MARLLMTKLGLSLVICAGCAASPNDVLVTVSPDVISSLDGTAQVHAIVMGDRDPVASKNVALTVSYTDRNGTDHAIAEVDGKTDQKGAFDATLTGLMWDGTATATVTVVGTKITGDATFAVLDRTPPKVTIEPATIHVNQQADVMVHATDEIGVSQVLFQVSGNNVGFGQNGDRSLIASGSTDVTLSFQFDTGNLQTGNMLTLYAIASDLSGNQGAATPVTVTVQ